MKLTWHHLRVVMQPSSAVPLAAVAWIPKPSGASVSASCHRLQCRTRQAALDRAGGVRPTNAPDCPDALEVGFDVPALPWRVWRPEMPPNLVEAVREAGLPFEVVECDGRQAAAPLWPWQGASRPTSISDGVAVPVGSAYLLP